MQASESLKLIIGELRKREIQAMTAYSLPDSATVALGISASAAQRFLDALVPTPLDADDALTLHIIGRPQDLTVGEEPWRFDGSVIATADDLVGWGAGAVELHITVDIPIADLPEVLRRLQGAMSRQ